MHAQNARLGPPITGGAFTATYTGMVSGAMEFTRSPDGLHLRCWNSVQSSPRGNRASAPIADVVIPLEHPFVGELRAMWEEAHHAGEALWARFPAWCPTRVRWIESALRIAARDVGSHRPRQPMIDWHGIRLIHHRDPAPGPEYAPAGAVYRRIHALLQRIIDERAG